MHELALVEGVIRVAEEECSRFPGHHVVSIELEIGQLRQVVTDVFQFLFELSARNTLLEHAHLVMDVRPVRVYCRTCGGEGGVNDPAWLACPDCGGFDVQMLDGDQFLVRSLNIQPNGMKDGY